MPPAADEQRGRLFFLQHDHSFHLPHEGYCARNGNLIARQEGHTINAMEIFGNAREVYRHARGKFGRLVKVRDISILWLRFLLMDDCKGVVRVKDLVCGQGNLQPLKPKELVKLAFPTPDNFRGLVDIPSE